MGVGVVRGGDGMSPWEQCAGASDEWYTPKLVFDALACRFDLDVASPRISTFVTADSFIYSDSLSQPWTGFIWMNPPFGKRGALHPWLQRFFDHGNGIALTPDRTSAPWFRYAWNRADLVLFTPRLRFWRPDGTVGASPAGGSAIWASGRAGEAAIRRAAANGLGVIGRPETLDLADVFG